MKHLSIAVSLVLLSACSMPLLALAQQDSAPDGPLARAMPGPPPGFGHGPGHVPGPGAPGLPPFLHGVELSEAQQDKVFAATYAQAPLLREQEKIAFKAHAQLRELAGSSAYDDAKAGALAGRPVQLLAGPVRAAACCRQTAATGIRQYSGVSSGFPFVAISPDCRRLACKATLGWRKSG